MIRNVQGQCQIGLNVKVRYNWMSRSNKSGIKCRPQQHNGIAEIIHQQKIWDVNLNDKRVVEKTRHGKKNIHRYRGDSNMYKYRVYRKTIYWWHILQLGYVKEAYVWLYIALVLSIHCIIDYKHSLATSAIPQILQKGHNSWVHSPTFSLPHFYGLFYRPMYFHYCKNTV